MLACMHGKKHHCKLILLGPVSCFGCGIVAEDTRYTAIRVGSQAHVHLYGLELETLHMHNNCALRRSTD